MTDIAWGQVRAGLSWHVFRTFTRVPGVAYSVCGRRLDADTVRDERPGNERTCETCLRIVVGIEEGKE